MLRWPVTFPAEKIKGRMLSGLGTLDIKGFSNSYSFYTSDNLEKKPEDTGKIISVRKQEGEIETVVFGPFTKRGNDTVEVQAPMRITFNGDQAIIRVDDSEHEVQVNGWSDWIRVKFKIDFMRDVYGIFKVYLLSVEPQFNMYVTSIQIDPENQMVDITYPKDYGKELAQEVGLFYTLGISEDTKAVNEGRIEKQIFLEQVKDIEESRTKMFWYEFNRFEEGVYAFIFDAGDRLQHIFWENKNLAGNESGIKISDEIENYYIEKDVFLGEVLTKLDNNTSLMVFSDHGFSSFERSVSINTWLVENGYMTLTQEPHEDDPGGLFKYVDWSKTKVYSFGFSSIYLNIEGRENKGIVDAEKKDKLIDEVIEKLSRLTDPKTGERVITNLYKGEEVYKGEYTKDAPDIVVGFERGYRMSWENALGGSTLEVFLDNERAWGGDHLIDKSHVPGILFTNFQIAKESPALINIAPTVLSLLGLDVPSSMEGESLTD